MFYEVNMFPYLNSLFREVSLLRKTWLFCLENAKFPHKDPIPAVQWSKGLPHRSEKEPQYHVLFGPIYVKNNIFWGDIQFLICLFKIL